MNADRALFVQCCANASKPRLGAFRVSDLDLCFRRDQKLRAELEESLRAMTRDYDQAEAARRSLAASNEAATRENK